jgi:glycosyltransferase involved in cell wall biosynthesis
MKILYSIHQFFPTYYFGTERYLLNLSKMMQKYGHDVHIITYQPHYEKCMKKFGELYIKKYVYDNLAITAIHIPGDQIPISVDLNNQSIHDYFLELFKNEKPDIFHIAHPMRMASAFYAAKKLNINTILTLTDFWVTCPKGILVKNSNQPCMGPIDGGICHKYCFKDLQANLLKQRVEKGRNIFKEADGIIISAKFVSDIYKINHYKTSKINIIRHGYNFFDNYNPIINKTPSKYFCFSSLCSIIPNKGIHLLIQAFKSLKLPKIKLKIYGDTTFDKEYFSYLKKLQNKDKRISFEGKYSLSDTAIIHQKIDTVIQPSLWYETYPLVCVAALAYGVPIIVPDLSGAKELVENNNGYIFKFGNLKSLQKKMEQAYNDNLKENSSIFYNHSVEEEAFLTEQLYYKIINNRK